MSLGFAIHDSKKPSFGTVFAVLTALTGLGHGGACSVSPLWFIFSPTSPVLPELLALFIVFFILSPRFTLLFHSLFLPCATQHICFF